MFNPPQLQHISNITVWGIFSTLLFFSIIPSSAFSQIQPQPTPPPRYSQIMKEGAYHLGLCENYLDSFINNKEISYLKLADHFCTESIKAYYRGYYYHFDNPRFRLNAQQKMGAVCDFYDDEVYDKMRYYGLPHSKIRTGADYCREK